MGLVDELETKNGMAVHAYLHRREGDDSNASYWYQRAGHDFQRSALGAEWDGWSIGSSLTHYRRTTNVVDKDA